MGLRRATSLIVAGAVMVGPLIGCTRSSEEPQASEAAQVEPIEGSDVARVTLTQEAADRLDIRTSPVTAEAVTPGGRSAIPYAAVLYDADGNTWAYTNPEPLVFVRARIRVDRIQNGMAVLSSGPSLGTEVVTTGAAELLGTEYEVGEE
jgi:hypothetical protein